MDFGTDSFYGARKAKIDHLVEFIALDDNAEKYFFKIYFYFILF